MFRLLCLLFVLAGCSGLSRPSSRLHGGTDADIKDTPYIASIEEIDFRFVCGAVIISSEWVLTDAFCQYFPEVTDFQVRVGTAKSSDGGGTAGGVLHDVVEWTRHPDAEPINQRYDFALVKVSPPFEFNENVAPATLPTLEQDTPEGDIGVIAGWGQTGDTMGPVVQLQSAPLTLVSDSECNVILAGNYTLSILCAKGAEGAGIALCWQDEGSPIVSGGTVYGITLWGQYCSDPNQVQLFSRVAHVRDWIDNTINF